MIFHISQCTGWTWDYTAENIDLPRMATMTAYWREFPPLHIMVAAYLEAGEQPAKPEPEQQGDFAELFSSIPQRG